MVAATRIANARAAAIHIAFIVCLLLDLESMVRRQSVVAKFMFVMYP
jgi:hypothetical protein